MYTYFMDFFLFCILLFLLCLCNTYSCKQEQIKQELDTRSTDADVNRCKPLSMEDKVKEQNRIQQLAYKAREKMPKDFKSFCLVAAHLVRNAHRYYKSMHIDQCKAEVDEVKKEMEDVDTGLGPNKKC